MNYPSIQVRIYGNTIAELEANALTRAREYTGPGYTLEVSEYTAHESYPVAEGKTNKLYADIRVDATRCGPSPDIADTAREAAEVTEAEPAGGFGCAKCGTQVPVGYAHHCTKGGTNTYPHPNYFHREGTGK